MRDKDGKDSLDLRITWKSVEWLVIVEVNLLF